MRSNSSSSSSPFAWDSLISGSSHVCVLSVTQSLKAMYKNFWTLSPCECSYGLIGGIVNSSQCSPDKDARVFVLLYCCCSRSVVPVPPTSRPMDTYTYHQIDPLSPSVRSGPSALQHDGVKSGPAGEEIHRPPQVRYTNPEPVNSWITNTEVSLVCSVTSVYAMCFSFYYYHMLTQTFCSVNISTTRTSVFYHIPSLNVSVMVSW